MNRRAGPGRAALAGILLAVIVVLLTPLSASAHAVLVSSSPANGARLAAAPAAVRLTFDERVGLVPGASIVLSAGGARVDTGGGHLSGDGLTLVLPLRAALPKDTYTVAWRVVSADSHVVSGSVRFGVRQDVTAARSAAVTWTGPDVAAAAADGIASAGAILLVGVPAVTIALWPSLLRRRRTRGLVAAGGIAVAIGTAGDLPLRGPRATGSGWSGVLRLDDLGPTLQSPAGIALLCRLALLAVAAVALRRALPPARPTRARTALLAATGTAVLGTIAVLGHAAAGSSAVWMVPVATLHLAGMAVWLGGLATLASVLLPRLRPAGLTRSTIPVARLLRPWSRLAFGAVALLIATGEVQALKSVTPIESLWTTDYGLLLLGKLLLVAVALAAATGSQRLVLRGGRTGTLQALRRAVAVEVAATVAVVAVTAVLVTQPTAEETYGPAVSAVAPLGPDDVDVHVSATRRGPTEIRVVALDGSGRPVHLDTVSGSLSTAGVAGLDVTFRRGPAQSWISTDAQAPRPGRWTLVLQVSVDQAQGYATSVGWSVW